MDLFGVVRMSNNFAEFSDLGEIVFVPCLFKLPYMYHKGND